MTAGWELSRSPYPLPPKNTSALCPFIRGVIDLRWESPTNIHANEGWIIRGVNIYRSGTSDRGTYKRINATPIGGEYYRDVSLSEMQHDEVITHWISKGKQDGTYTFQTKYSIARIGSSIEPTSSGRDVVVKVDGRITPVYYIVGQTGEVTLSQGYRLDPINSDKTPDLIINDNSVVTITYLGYSIPDKIAHVVDKKTYYRVTTVAEDPTTGVLHETPLNYSVPFSDIEIEKMDWMWREGVRRNQWALEQGGERVRLFLKKITGIPCHCRDFNRKTLIYMKQPDSRCKICFGTGIEGGYEGPYDIIIAPDDSERRISQAVQGRRLEHSYETYIGPSPIVQQRDFIVKQNNDRYSIGPVRRPNARGNVLQQHFNLGFLDIGDIRYDVPMDGVPLVWQKTKYTYQPIRDTYNPRGDAPYQTEPDSAIPMENDRPDISKNHLLRGRTAVWENHNSGG
jgi:hypothetical protein